MSKFEYKKLHEQLTFQELKEGGQNRKVNYGAHRSIDYSWREVTDKKRKYRIFNFTFIDNYIFQNDLYFTFMTLRDNPEIINFMNAWLQGDCIDFSSKNFSKLKELYFSGVKK